MAEEESPATYRWYKVEVTVDVSYYFWELASSPDEAMAIATADTRDVVAQDVAASVAEVLPEDQEPPEEELPDAR